MGTQLPLPKKGAEPLPQLSAHVHCSQTAGWIKMALGMEVGLGPRHIVLDGDPALRSKKGAETPPIFGHFYCGQTAGYIKMSLGMEVGLSPGDQLCVRWGPFPIKGQSPPIFSPRLLWPIQTAAWIKMPVWYGGRPRHRPHCKFGSS